MSNLNLAQLIGRLGADPEVRYTAGGDAIANLRIATSEKWRDKQTGDLQESVEWHRVVFFKRQAEICEQYLRKGSLVYVSGQLRTRKWQDRDGQDRYTTEVRGFDMKMLGGKGDSTAAPVSQSQQPVQQDGFDDDIPF